MVVLKRRTRNKKIAPSSWIIRNRKFWIQQPKNARGNRLSKFRKNNICLKWLTTISMYATLLTQVASNGIQNFKSFVIASHRNDEAEIENNNCRYIRLLQRLHKDRRGERWFYALQEKTSLHTSSLIFSSIEGEATTLNDRLIRNDTLPLPIWLIWV